MGAQAGLKRDEKIIFREEGDTGLLFNPENGRINILNSTGKFIWPFLDGKNKREDIIKQMLEAFAVSDAKKV